MEQLVRLDTGLIFWTWLTFFVVLAILAWKAWRPMIDALERREERIRSSLEAADRAKAEAERLTTVGEEQLRQARHEAQEILTKTRVAAERMRAELEEVARKQADDLITKAQEQINAEQERALREIRTTVVDLSLSMATKVIQRNLTTEDNRKLVEESLQNVGKA